MNELIERLDKRLAIERATHETGHIRDRERAELIRLLSEAAAALEAAREDVERLDALEALVKESSERALLLHHGWHKPREPSFCGLGLGNTGRTLRQAIDQARGKGKETKG